MRICNRRSFMTRSAAFATSIASLNQLAANEDRQALPVAAIVTVYRENSHADVIIGKILEGFDQKGGPGPALNLVGLYTDQVPKNDMSRDLASKYDFRISKSIDEALTLGTNRLQVKGVLSIGEHGDYPVTPNTKQRMYPRRRFFDAITSTFRRVGQVAPVFNDKHLSFRWRDAKHMYDTATKMSIPFMAGSSLPVTWRRPAIDLPRGSEVEEAIVVGYGGLESYGFHALESLQCMVERRKGGETGVVSVQAVKGEEIRKARDDGRWSQELFDAALKTMPDRPSGDLKQLNKDAAFYLIEYQDGLKATVAMANGIASQKSFAARVPGHSKPLATWFELEHGKPYGHFSHLTRAIEHMIHTERAAYPVERTLLTTGMLDAVMHSLANGGRRETPELSIRYQPVDWPFANQTVG